MAQNATGVNEEVLERWRSEVFVFICFILVLINFLGCSFREHAASVGVDLEGF